MFARSIQNAKNSDFVFKKKGKALKKKTEEKSTQEILKKVLCIQEKN